MFSININEFNSQTSKLMHIWRKVLEDDIYTESGSHDQLMDKYNLNPEHIAQVVVGAK